MRLMSDLDHIAGCSHQTLRYNKSCGKFVVIAGCPHDHRNAVAFDPDFQRLFGGQVIPVLGNGGVLNPAHCNFFDSPAECGGASHEHFLTPELLSGGL